MQKQYPTGPTEKAIKECTDAQTYQLLEKMQVKRKDIITYLSEWLNYKNCDNIQCEGVEKLSHSYIDDGNVNSPSMLENVF